MWWENGFCKILSNRVVELERALHEGQAEFRENRSYVFTLNEITQGRMRDTYAFLLDVHLTQFCMMAYG